MIDFLLQIIVWVMCALIVLGIISLFMMMVMAVITFIKGKPSKGDSSAMQWWVWWSSHHNH